MPADLARAAPPSLHDAPIAPQHLWPHLSNGQQQHVRQVLIQIAQHLVAHEPPPASHEETRYDFDTPLESSEIDSGSS